MTKQWYEISVHFVATRDDFRSPNNRSLSSFSFSFSRSGENEERERGKRTSRIHRCFLWLRPPAAVGNIQAKLTLPRFFGTGSKSSFGPHFRVSLDQLVQTFERRANPRFHGWKFGRTRDVLLGEKVELHLRL